MGLTLVGAELCPTTFRHAGLIVDRNRVPRAPTCGPATRMIPPPCTSPDRQVVCRLRHEIDENTPGGQITWRFTVLMLRDLLRRPVFGVDRDDLAAVEDCLWLSLGSAVERAVIQLESKRRPKWLP